MLIIRIIVSMQSNGHKYESFYQKYKYLKL